MITTIGTSEKKKYSEPQIVRVELDNEISLALESAPPGGPGDEPGFEGSLAPGYFNTDPFKSNQC